MLTLNTPTTLATELTISQMGVKSTFNIVFNNVTEDEISDTIRQAATELAAMKDDNPQRDIRYPSIKAFLRVVKEWEAEATLDFDGVLKMEKARPGIMEAIFSGYHKARAAELAKN